MSDLIRKYVSAQSSHTHDDHHQIIIPVTGNLELDVEGTQGLVGMRTIGVITQGETHAFRAPDDNSFLVLDIEDQRAENNLKQVWDRAVDAPFISMSEALLSLTDYAVFCSRQSTSQEWLETWQKLFLQTIACEIENDLPQLPERLKKAITYMETNLGRNINNADLADVSCLSPARFYELFRKSTGTSPQEYLTHCRLNAAKRLITEGKPLVQVADEVGFSDQSTFGRAFRKAFGISPGKWREQELLTK